ncbi:T9SS type A sorting domain-containing protein [Algibacter mikhailovii]|uniref:T9SS type A sorting domain-containing protein n=1 Tax=Algibacter mikhailovii TaxID=425498 RepID=UPI00249424E5|nr:T9SS type A sorting domain-containing protein [Algibacter mikhailovii]
MNKFLIVLFCPFFMFGQIQIGQDINGKNGFIGNSFGKSVSMSSDGSIIAVGAPLNSNKGTYSGQVKIYERIGTVWTQIGTDIQGENSGDRFGTSVSLSSNGNIIAIGAPQNDGNGDNSGHVRVYKNVDRNWVQIGSNIEGESTSDYSGESISLSSDGNIVIIGAPRNKENGFSSGHVRVYKNISGNWQQMGNDINGDNPRDIAGMKVSLSSDGSMLALTALEDNNSVGRVRVYENIDGSWIQIGQDIKNENFGNPFGFSLDLSGNGQTLAIGLIESTVNSIINSVKIFELNKGNWLQKGNTIIGQSKNEFFGESISLSDNGNSLIIGAPKYDENNVKFGRVQMYKFNENIWIQTGNDIIGENFDSSFGSSVEMSSDGNFIIIGGPNNDANGFNSGHVQVYQNVNNSWVQVGSDVDGDSGMSGDYLGHSISLSNDGNILAVGAAYNDGTSVQSGQVRVYESINGNWEQIGNHLNGKSSYDHFGYSLSLSSNGKILAVGAPENDTNGEQSGQVRIFENINGDWIQIGTDLNGSSAYDFFGLSLSLSSDGKILAVGPPDDDGNRSVKNTGYVKVYQFLDNNWVPMGDNIDRNAVDDGIGQSISLSADGYTLALCADLNPSIYDRVIRVYKFSNGNWVKTGNDINEENELDLLRFSIDLSGDGSVLAIGCRRNSEIFRNTGHVRVFENSLNEWVQIGNDIDGSRAYDGLGSSISLSSNGTILAVGARGIGSLDRNTGFVNIYRNDNNNWIQVGNDILGESAFDNFGFALDTSDDGNIVAISGPYNDENGENAGQVKVYDLSAVLSTQSFKQDYFSFYPNPVKGILHIQLNSGQDLKQVNIYNLQSQYLYSVQTSKIDVSDLSSGLYFIEVVTNKGKSAKKIIIQ